MKKTENMEFIQHTTNWVNGEILEAVITIIIGLLIITSSVLFWKFGTTPYAKSLVIPLLIVGLIPFINGVFSVNTNKNRLLEYRQAWQENEQQFILSEKERVQGFDNIFKYSYPFAIIMVTGGAILFFLLKSPMGKAISLAMMTLGLMAYFIDHFAKERADIYLQHIEKRLK